MGMLPQLNNVSKYSNVQSEFRGYNHNEYIDDTEIYDMTNMSVDKYPYASPRQRRSQYTSFDGSDINGIATKQGFCFVDGTDFYYRKKNSDEYHLVGNVEDSEKQFVSMGAYILIFPDKKYFWTYGYEHWNDGDEWWEEHGLKKKAYFGSLEATTEVREYKLALCDVFGEEYQFDIVSETQPAEAHEEEGNVWLQVIHSDPKHPSNTNVISSRIMQYSESYSGWLEIVPSWVKITPSNTTGNSLGTDYEDYDGVTLSNFGEFLADFNTSVIIYKIVEEIDQTHSIVIPGSINIGELFNVINTASPAYKCAYSYSDQNNTLTISYLGAVSTDAKFTISRKIPDMNYICEQDNRVWGCSNENHEIYASKAGSPFNFNCFLNQSTDSYVASIGSDGDFTGCISHLGYVLFFKEDRVHRIYGTKPTNYQITEVAMRGVQQGCNRSMCIVNETLFYKSKVGVMMYQGSLPELISSELGTEYYTDAVAAECKGKYYISMKDSNNVWWLFAYDTETGLWHKEDNTQFKYVLSTLDELYYIDGNNKLNTILGTGKAFKTKLLDGNVPETSGVADKESEYTVTEYAPTKEDSVEWMFESGDLYDGSIDHKYISRLRIAMQIAQNTRIKIYLKYDNEDWKYICTKEYMYREKTKNTFNIPIVVRRARRMKIKLVGKGDCYIQAIGKVIESGSEI